MTSAAAPQAGLSPAGADAEHGGDLRLRQLQVKPEHQHFPAPRGKRRQRGQDLPAVLRQQRGFFRGQRRAGCVLFRVPADQQPPPHRVTAAVDHRGAQVGQQVAVRRVPALVHPHEHVLDDVFPGPPFTDDERGQPDKVGAVQPEHLTEITRRMRRGLHAHHTNCAPLWLPAHGNYAAMLPPR
jgi:hypothetical protein